MLATWLSADDFVRLIERVFRIPVLGCPIVYGVSNNDATWWDNAKVSYLGWHPNDNAEMFREKLDATMAPPDPGAADAVWHGGTFASDGIHED